MVNSTNRCRRAAVMLSFERAGRRAALLYVSILSRSLAPCSLRVPLELPSSLLSRPSSPWTNRTAQPWGPRLPAVVTPPRLQLPRPALVFPRARSFPCLHGHLYAAVRDDKIVAEPAAAGPLCSSSGCSVRRSNDTTTALPRLPACGVLAPIAPSRSWPPRLQPSTGTMPSSSTAPNPASLFYDLTEKKKTAALLARLRRSLTPRGADGLRAPANQERSATSAPTSSLRRSAFSAWQSICSNVPLT